MADPLGLAILRGIHAVTLEQGWILRRFVSWVLAGAVEAWKPDAVILVLDEGYPSTVEALRDQHVISAGHDLTRFHWSSVVPDEPEIGRLAARHFLDRGIVSLGVFGYWNTNPGKVPHPWAIRRADGFIEVAVSEQVAVSRFGDRIDPDTGLPEDDNLEAIKRWLTELPKPVGIFAPCDDWAHILSVIVRSIGFRVPEDVAIVGVDDEWTTCETNDPPLSSVAIQWELIGRSAARMAGEAAKKRSKASPMVVVPPAPVTVRQSSDTMAVRDPDVAAALSMILANANRPLKVSEILRRVPATQRNLERQFKKHVGRRMIDEIRRVHVELAKRLLAGSDLAMPIVARKCGFAGATQLGIAFRRETGTTPSQFRRRYRAG